MPALETDGTALARYGNDLYTSLKPDELEQRTGAAPRYVLDTTLALYVRVGALRLPALAARKAYLFFFTEDVCTLHNLQLYILYHRSTFWKLVAAFL